MIGNILRNMRLKAGFSQRDLAKLLNMADTTISSYERGNSQPDFKTIMTIAQICGYEFKLYEVGSNKLIDLEEMSREP